MVWSLSARVIFFQTALIKHLSSPFYQSKCDLNDQL